MTDEFVDYEDSGVAARFYKSGNYEIAYKYRDLPMSSSGYLQVVENRVFMYNQDMRSGMIEVKGEIGKKVAKLLGVEHE